MRIAKEWKSMAPRFYRYVKFGIPTMNSIGAYLNAFNFISVSHKDVKRVTRYGTSPTIFPTFFPNSKDPFSAAGFQLSLDDIMGYEKNLPGSKVANKRGQKFPKVGALLLCHLFTWTNMAINHWSATIGAIEAFQFQLYGKVVVFPPWRKFNIKDFGAVEEAA